jgi:hypothetical protein
MDVRILKITGMTGHFSRTEVVTWENNLQRAYSAENVVSVVNDFLATWEPQRVGGASRVPSARPFSR